MTQRKQRPYIRFLDRASGTNEKPAVKAVVVARLHGEDCIRTKKFSAVREEDARWKAESWFKQFLAKPYEVG